MAKVDFQVNNTKTGPVWLSDWGDRRTLLPGGVKLVAADFAETATGSGIRPVKAGTLIGRTFTEAEAGTGFSPWVTGDDEVYLVWADIIDAVLKNDADVVRPESLIKDNLLPGWAARPAGEKAAIRAAYQTQTGVM